jgi:hypothetical protein
MSATLEAMAAMPAITEFVDTEDTGDYPVPLDSGTVGQGDKGTVETPAADGTGVVVAPVVAAAPEDASPSPTSPVEGEDATAPPVDNTAEADAAAVAEKAGVFDSLVQAYTQNPVGYVQELIRNAQLTPAQMQQLGIGQTQAAAPGVIDATSEEGWADADLTKPELFVKQTRGLVAELPRFAQEVQGTFGQHSAYIVQALNQNAELKAQIDALCELNDIKLPASKFTAYDQKQHEAYAGELKKVIGTRKAALVATPNTPGNTGGGGGALGDQIEPRGGGDPFVSLFKQVAAAARK